MFSREQHYKQRDYVNGVHREYIHGDGERSVEIHDRNRRRWKICRWKTCTYVAEDERGELAVCAKDTQQILHVHKTRLVLCTCIVFCAFLPQVSSPLLLLLGYVCFPPANLLSACWKMRGALPLRLLRY